MSTPAVPAPESAANPAPTKPTDAAGKPKSTAGAASPSKGPGKDAKDKSLNVNAKSFVPKGGADGSPPPPPPPPTNVSPLGVARAAPPGMLLPGGPALPPPVPGLIAPLGAPQLMHGMPFMPPPILPLPGGLPLPIVPPGGLVQPGFVGGVRPPAIPLGAPPPPPMAPHLGGGNQAPSGRVPVPMAPGYVTSPLIQPPPLAPIVPSPVSSGGASGQNASPSTPLSGNPAVSVGNATLVAKRSAVPPKPGCVLLAGITGVGKTTAGRQLVNELNEDKLGWEFFSGADFIKDSPNVKPSNWETTKSVFDGLNDFLDRLLAKQTLTPIRGILIDKQLRGVEDLYYLTQLLRSKGLLLWGVIGMDCNSDEVLVSRLGNGPGAIEKVKFHRVVYSRIVEAAKHVGIWRTVDASVSKADAVRMLRTMVLGCSSQSPTKQFSSQLYHDGTLPMVDNYATYYSVMNSLFTIIPRNAKGQAAFPGFTSYVPLPSSMLDPKKLPLKDFSVRRKVDGTKYILYFDGLKLYMIPRHMRCAFEAPQEAWLGVHLANTGKFVVDGDLVRSKERGKEKFVVFDIIFWAEKGSQINTVARSTWKERQEKLKTNLCSESSAFYPKKGDLVIVHQTILEEHKGLVTLLTDNSTDYPTDGLIFHSPKKEDPVYVWRPPEAITADFRLGVPTVKADGNRVFPLEVFDQKIAKYVQYRNDTTEISANRSSAVEGAFVTCTMDATTANPSLTAAHTWTFSRVRNDVSSSLFKAQVDDLLRDCIIPKQLLIDYVAAVDAKNPHAAPSTKQPLLGGEKQPVAPVAGAPASGTPTAVGAAGAPTLGGASPPQAKVTRSAFGSALAGPEGLPPDFSSNSAAAAGATPSLRDVVAGDHRRTAPRAESNELVTDAQKLSTVVSNVKVKNVTVGQSDVAVLQSIVGSVSVVTGADSNAASDDRDVEADRRRGRRNDADRSRPLSKSNGNGRVDVRDGKFYTYEEWAQEGVEFCQQCNDFASGRRDNNARGKPFYCDACWDSYSVDDGKRRTAARKEKGRKPEGESPTEGEGHKNKEDVEEPNPNEESANESHKKTRRSAKGGTTKSKSKSPEPNSSDVGTPTEATPPAQQQAVAVAEAA